MILKYKSRSFINQGVDWKVRASGLIAEQNAYFTIKENNEQVSLQLLQVYQAWHCYSFYQAWNYTL